MATIIEFKSRVEEMNYICDTTEDNLNEDWTAEIIIFPGIRYERHTDEDYEVEAELNQG